MEQKKHAVSIRVGESDLRNIKRMAVRVGVRDSDIIRYAIKTMLNRMSPLCDEAMRGLNLLPMLVESGDELIRYFDLDAFRLESIINEQAETDLRVERDDIALLSMSGLRQEYLLMRMSHASAEAPESPPNQLLRSYLYDKYVYRHGGSPTIGEPSIPSAQDSVAVKRPAA